MLVYPISKSHSIQATVPSALHMPTIYKPYNESHLEKNLYKYMVCLNLPFRLGVTTLCLEIISYVPVLRNCIEENYLVSHGPNFITKLIRSLVMGEACLLIHCLYQMHMCTLLSLLYDTMFS